MNGVRRAVIGVLSSKNSRTASIALSLFIAIATSVVSVSGAQTSTGQSSQPSTDTPLKNTSTPDSEEVKRLREGALRGDSHAQCALGLMYEAGESVTQDNAEAVKWYHAAAEQGEPQAQFNLGYFYETGQVVPQNYVEAVKWYRLSAEQECAPAQCNLGLCYETGRGVPQDVREAVRWFCRAARQGDKTAQHNLGVYYANLEAAEKATADADAPEATADEAQ